MDRCQNLSAATIMNGSTQANVGTAVLIRRAHA